MVSQVLEVTISVCILKKLIREYIIYGESVTIKNDGEEIVYLVNNEDKLETYINVLVENFSLSKHNKTTSSNIVSYGTFF
ncbi:hypothetical protein EVI01_16910 [Enterococcus villorum]|uniref:Uncharacterized protein n=2 Tax=Enterococcus villorum TaxID=112904 RepID=A0A511J325_9ENTE|nr:hypothetical protein UAO_01399 [Enterococcus villorum ATCC 700913]EOW78384.1 hypothetical protein I591_01240 [Enterococcus villorum ATCC 700913]GEL92354.1 hypothetical protein EVI01_16910 [Enterococcus villorum]